jgi:hypothetical protein
MPQMANVIANNMHSKGGHLNSQTFNSGIKGLTFKKQMGQHCPTECVSFSSERENTVPQLTLKLNRALAAAETWDLKGHTLKVKSEANLGRSHMSVKHIITEVMFNIVFSGDQPC